MSLPVPEGASLLFFWVPWYQPSWLKRIVVTFWWYPSVWGPAPQLVRAFIVPKSRETLSCPPSQTLGDLGLSSMTALTRTLRFIWSSRFRALFPGVWPLALPLRWDSSGLHGRLALPVLKLHLPSNSLCMLNLGPNLGRLAIQHILNNAHHFWARCWFPGPPGHGFPSHLSEPKHQSLLRLIRSARSSWFV